MIRDRYLADSRAVQRPAVQFYFDFTSPDAYIASEWIEAVAARHGRRVQWRAVVMADACSAEGMPSSWTSLLQRDYALRDFERSARFAGLPYRQPETFPIPTDHAARVFWWLQDRDPAEAVAWAHAGLRAYFTRGVLLNDAAAMKALLAESNVDADAAEAAWCDPTWVARLHAENDAAMAAGVFGAPYVVVDGEPFCGNERQVQIERWLASGPFKGLR
jgi:2-hydroxychromene-2-carboxylate isomerase